MEKHLKKRIVGAVVTVMAVAITLPVIIDGSRQRLTLDEDIPPMPPMPEWAEVENQKRIRIDLEKLASGDAANHLQPPPMDTSPADDPVPQKVIAAPVPAPVKIPVPQVVSKTPPAAVAKPVVPPKPDLSNVPQLDDNDLPYAWVVQLGAFANDVNAREFRDSLRQQGFKAYTNTQIDGLTRVYAGPELKRNEAESLRQRLVLLLDNDNLPIKRYRAR